MSQALQRVIVRMLHDPRFADAVYSGTELPELSAAERAMLVAVDRRAWATDPYRRSRLLQALIEEYPASSAELSAWGEAIPRLDAYLSSPAFHRCIQVRGVVALDFGAWLVDRVGAVAVVEHALARARRPGRLTGDGLVVAPGVVPLIVREGAVERLAAIRSRLGTAPIDTLVRRTASGTGLPALAGGEEAVLVEQEGLSYAPRALVEALLEAREPRSREELIAVLARLGAEDAASEVLDDLLRDRLLVEVGPAR